jgi:hypothetical protein
VSTRPEIWDALQEWRATGTEPGEAADRLAARVSELLAAPRIWKADGLKALRDVWGEGLDGCELVIDGCVEVCGLFHGRYHGRAEVEDEQRFLVLRDLFQRGHDAAWEAHVLLSHGAPGGALARWRTVHELNVVSAFIRRGDADLARRYKDWHRIEAKRSIIDVTRAMEALGATIEAEGLFEFLEKDQAELEERYGRSFTRDFGWADQPLREQGIVTNGKPRLWHLEQAVGGLGRRGLYRMASHAGHAVLFSGAIRVPDQFGPKPVGLHAPSRYVCLDLWMTAGNFVSLYQDEEFRWALDVLGFVIVDADSALQRAERHARKRWPEQ